MMNYDFFMPVVSKGAEFLLVLFITAIVIFVTKRVLSSVKKFSNNDWVTTLCDVLSKPARLVLGILGLLIAFEIALRGNEVIISKIVVARYVFTIAVATWLLFKWKLHVEKILTKRFLSKSKNKKNDQIIISAVSKVISIFIAVIAGLMLLDVVGVPLQGLLAFGGVSGIAISWAAKDIVANFFGGFMIYVNRPFVIGDWIKSPNKDFEGTVEDIGWYMTRICTFEKRPMYIPNALITDAIIENPGRMYNRRIKLEVSLRYEDMDKVKVVVQDIEQMLQKSQDIDHDQRIRVALVSFDPYSIGIEVYAFTKTTDSVQFRKVQQQVLLEIAQIVDKNEAQMPIPTSRVEVAREE